MTVDETQPLLNHYYMMCLKNRLRLYINVTRCIKQCNLQQLHNFVWFRSRVTNVVPNFLCTSVKVKIKYIGMNHYLLLKLDPTQLQIKINFCKKIQQETRMYVHIYIQINLI